MRIERHPQLNIWVREDGCVYLPQSGVHKAHWTYGSRDGWGYMNVGVAGKTYKVHQLVAQTFLGPIPEGYDVDHINRQKDQNSVVNLRIVPHHENMRNMLPHDRVTERGGTHSYEDKKQFKREQQGLYRQTKCKTHRQVRFYDGRLVWIPLAEAESILKIPLKQRVFHK